MTLEDIRLRHETKKKKKKNCLNLPLFVSKSRIIKQTIRDFRERGCFSFYNVLGEKAMDTARVLR